MDTSPPLCALNTEPFSKWQQFWMTLLACVGTTLVATPMLDYLDLANIVMLFLLTVLIVAVKLGRNAAILASVLSVLFFDIFFVPPRFSLAVSNIQYVVTFAVMLLTALVTAHLAAGLKQRAQESYIREQKTAALYQFTRELSGVLTLAQLISITQGFIASQFNACATLLLPNDDQSALHPIPDAAPVPVEAHAAKIAFNGDKPVSSTDLGGMGYASLYLPLKASMRIRGVLAIRFTEQTTPPVKDSSLALLEILASLIAVAVERMHYIEVAQATEVKMLTERLRSSILSALSHDLRTPLTAMVGLADTLFLVNPPLPQTALETAQALQEQAKRLASMVANLLDMARLNAGNVSLRLEWQPIEEVIGASIKLLGSALAQHPVKVQLPNDLPLVEFDAVLIERVFCNLLENAAKYAKNGSEIVISVQQLESQIKVFVTNKGSCFPESARDDVFNMFVRGSCDTKKPGTGLGLAICKAIVEAHGGRIQVNPTDSDSASISFTLPKGTPPVVEDEIL